MTQQTGSVTTVGVGVIGLGIIGTRHVGHVLNPDSPTTLAGVHDLDPARTEQVAREHDTFGAPNLDDLLARPEVEAVVIAVPSGLHRDVAIAALRAGKHVLLEKPIDITVDAADAILAAHRESGAVLTVASQRRFAPVNLHLRELIQQGHLGSITAASIDLPFWRSQEYYDSAGWRGTWAMDGGGALMNQGVHLVDLALWLLGDVEEVYAHTALLAHRDIEVEDTVTITARLTGGTLMTFLATTAAYDPPPLRISIAGDRGSVVTVNEEIVHHTAGPLDPPTAAAVARDLADPKHRQLLQLVDFVEAITEGRQPLVTPGQARNAVAFIEAVYESGRTGRPIVPRR